MQKFRLKTYLKVLSFLMLCAGEIFYSLPVFAQNFNALSSQIAKKNFDDSKNAVLLLDGVANFSLSQSSQNQAYEARILPDGASKNYQNSQTQAGNDTQLFFKGGFMDQKKRIFGGIAKAEFNYNTSGRSESPNLDQSFLFAENNFGRFEFGNYFAVNQKMKFGPAQIARGAGGINGKYLEQVNFPTLSNGANCSLSAHNGDCLNLKNPRFITLAQSPIGHGGYGKSFYRLGARNDYSAHASDYLAFNRSNFRALKDDSYDGVEDATKFSFYSPRIEGLQLGLSYAPSSNGQGATKKTALDVDELRLSNIFSFGANYSQEFDNLEVKLSLTGEHAKSRNSGFAAQRRDLNSYDLAANFGYFGFNFAASYGSWGKSLQPKSGVYACDYNQNLALASQDCSIASPKFKKADYFSSGISYEIGPIGASITSLRSNFQNNKFSAISFGIDYKIKKNLLSYFEITHFAFKANQPKLLANSSHAFFLNNSGNVLLVGTAYYF